MKKKNNNNVEYCDIDVYNVLMQIQLSWKYFFIGYLKLKLKTRLIKYQTRPKQDWIKENITKIGLVFEYKYV